MTLDPVADLRYLVRRWKRLRRQWAAFELRRNRYERRSVPVQDRASENGLVTCIQFEGFRSPDLNSRFDMEVVER